MKKVLYAASSKFHIQMFHLPYIKWFIGQGYQVDVLVGEDGTDLSMDGARILSYPFEKSVFSRKNWGICREISKQIEQEKYDIIFTHTSLASFFVRMAVKTSKHKNVRVITTVHGYLFDVHDSWIKRTFMLLTEKVVSNVTQDLVIMNEEDYAIATQHKLCKGQIVQISCMGFDQNAYLKRDEKLQSLKRSDLGIKENAKLLVYAAEFSTRKNHSMLIRVMEKLPEDYELLLLGDGVKYQSILNMVEKKKLTSRVHFMGKVNGTAPYLKLCDLAVSTSRYEGKPFHLIEAMSIGIPIVASDVKGNHELGLIDGEYSLFPYDDINAMAKCIMKKINCPKNRQQVMEHIKQNYNLTSCMSVMQKLFEERSEV